MDLLELLEKHGFSHHLNDEPYEDYWILERNGSDPDYLVEKDAGLWSIHRSPDHSEPQGQWIEDASDLSEDECYRKILSLLG